MLQSKGKLYTQAAEDFQKEANDDEDVLASVLMGMSTWLLTNQRLVKLSFMGKVKAATPLGSIQSVRMEPDGFENLYITESGGSEFKLGAVADVAQEFLALLETTLEGVPRAAEEAGGQTEMPESKSAEAPDLGPKEQKRLEAEQKKTQRAEAKEKKKEAERARKAEEKANYGREVLSEMVGLKTVKFYEKGFVKVGMLADFEELTGIEGSADNLQKKSAAGRTAGFVFTGGLNMLGSNKRGDLLITITTKKDVHTLHVDAPYEHDLKSHHRIVSVGKSLLESSKSQENQGTTALAPSMSDEIGKLSALKDAGVLTEEEFTEAKKRLLGL